MVKKFLTPISKISEQCTLHITPDCIYSLAAQDSKAILYCKINTTQNITAKLNFNNIKNIIKIFNCINDDDIKLQINDTDSVIKYRSPSMSFTHHLVVDEVMHKMPISKDRIDSFEYQGKFNLPMTKIIDILKGDIYGADESGISKTYLFIKDGKVYFELTDKSRDDQNSIIFLASEHYQGESPNQSFAFDLNIFRLIEHDKNIIPTISINTEYKVINITLSDDNRELQYIVPTFVK
jgi:hypothetical protein